MIQEQMNTLLAKVFKEKAFFIPCGKYSTTRILSERNRRNASDDIVDGDRFTLFRGQLSKLRPLYILQGDLEETDGGCNVFYHIFPNWLLLIPMLVFCLASIYGIIALATGHRALLFLISTLGLTALTVGTTIWQAQETSAKFERGMLAKSRKYTEIVPE